MKQKTLKNLAILLLFVYLPLVVTVNLWHTHAVAGSPDSAVVTAPDLPSGQIQDGDFCLLHTLLGAWSATEPVSGTVMVSVDLPAPAELSLITYRSDLSITPRGPPVI